MRERVGPCLAGLLTCRNAALKRTGSALVCGADYYENLLTQDSQEDSDRTPDIYSSPIECFPLGTEVVFNSSLLSFPPPPTIRTLLVCTHLITQFFLAAGSPQQFHRHGHRKPIYRYCRPGKRFKIYIFTCFYHCWWPAGELSCSDLFLFHRLRQRSNNGLIATVSKTQLATV